MVAVLREAFDLLRMVALPPHDVSGRAMWDEALAKVEQLKGGEVMGELSSEEKERRIDEFLSGWGGLKETRKTAEFYLRWNSWDVSLAQARYWHEVILPYEYQFNE